MFEEVLPNQCVLLVCQGNAQLLLQMLRVEAYLFQGSMMMRKIMKGISLFVSELACFVVRLTWVWILVLVHIAFMTWGKLFKHKASIAWR